MAETSNNLELRHFLKLLTPSSVSATLCLLASLAVPIGIIGLSRYQNSGVKKEYDYYKSHVHANRSHFENALLSNNIVNNLPLLLFWAIVGLFVYVIAADLVKTIRSGIELKKELDWVNVHRQQLIRNVLERLAIRIVAAIIWIFYAIFFIEKIIPYVTALPLIALSSGGWAKIIIYAFLSILFTWLALHIHVILLRLVYLKARLFSQL